MVDKADPERVFVTKDWVEENLSISKAHQERMRRDGTLPQLVVLGGNARDPQARVAYWYSEIMEFARTRPRRPTRLTPPDDSDEERPDPSS